MDKEINGKGNELMKALAKAGLIKTDNPAGFWGKITITCQASKIVHTEKVESIKLD